MDFRQRLEQSKIHTQDSVDMSELDAPFVSPYFAAERGSRPPCLDLRFSNGNRTAISYSYFIEMSFDADAGIEILTSQKRITITGRNLSTLYEYLVLYRIRYVQANLGNDTQEDGPFVKAITVEINDSIR